MRTNIDIDDALLAAAMRAGAFTTKKDAVEAGLKLLARQAAYQEILRLRGQLRWQETEETVDATPEIAKPAALYGTADNRVSDVATPRRRPRKP